MPHPKYITPISRALPQKTRKKLLDGVIIPTPLENSATLGGILQYGGVWYQTSNETPFLYLPPVESYLTDDIVTPHVSIDVLIASTTIGGDHIVLTGWFNFLLYEWQYYGVPNASFNDFTPYYWSYLPPTKPLGWS